jgi:hypothetical protein
MFKRPKLQPKGDLVEVLSQDTADDLLEFVSAERAQTLCGRIIGDVYLIHDQLANWLLLKEADEITPFCHGSKDQKHIYRFWWLSRKPTENNIEHGYYNGCWFDLKIRKTAGREHIEMVRLCQVALDLCKQREELFEQLYGI